MPECMLRMAESSLAESEERESSTPTLTDPMAFFSRSIGPSFPDIDPLDHPVSYLVECLPGPFREALASQLVTIRLDDALCTELFQTQRKSRFSGLPGHRITKVFH